MQQSKNIRIKPSFSVVAHDADTVELRHGVWNVRSYTLTDHARTGRLYGLLSGLDGSTGRAEVAKANGVTRAEIEALVDHLDQLGVIARGPETALDAYIESTGAYVAETPAPPVVVLGGAALADATARVLDPSAPAGVEVAGEDDPLHRALLEADLVELEDGLAFERFVERFEPWRGKLLVHVAEEPHPLRLSVLNRVALALRTPWIQAAVDGPMVMIGPSFFPPTSACFACFETRVLMNLRESAGYQRYKDALVRQSIRVGRPPTLDALRALVAGHVGLEALNLALTGSTTTLGKVLGIYVPTMEIAYSEVLRLPGCRACGPVVEREATELYFDVRRWIDA
ncbi:TOMM precursor leader peptide-binding protein [Streptosporangium sp. NPDC000396]|uniref:TOMM precursor leader peptide-binding protein n=1 Tax=Streptosporangium sp. NPDC000396 TaxID=3366185 RepID=UPI0036B0AEAA